MARSDPDVHKLLADVLKVPPPPMWLAVHREIRTNHCIRAVYDFLGHTLPDLL